MSNEIQIVRLLFNGLAVSRQLGGTGLHATHQLFLLRVALVVVRVVGWVHRCRHITPFLKIGVKNGLEVTLGLNISWTKTPIRVMKTAKCE